MSTEESKKSERQRFEKLLKSMQIFCQVFCASPVIDPYGKISMRHRLHKVWCLTTLLYIYVVSYMESQRINLKRPTIEKALYFSEFITNCAIVTALISSAYYYADQYTSLPPKLKFLDIITADYELGRPLYSILYTELRLLSFLMGSFLFSCFAVDLVFHDFKILESLCSCGAYNLPNVLTSLNLIQYWLGLRFICLLYKRLNDALERLQLLNTDYPKDFNFINSFEEELKSMPWTSVSDWYRREFTPWAGKTVLLAEYLDFLRGLYLELDSLLAQMSDIFGLVVLLNFFGSFLDLAIEYFAVYKFYDKPDLKSIVLFVYKLLWLVLHTGRIFFILLTNHAVTKEKYRTFFLLNGLPTNTKDIERAINRFHFQLMVRKPAETACGIIDLDLLFLGGFNSALVTYVIFLIQIDLGNLSMHPMVVSNKTM